ncbi:MAG: LLM class F420-dependent oxidoreductase [Pseudomonadales bacterium]|jgi:probable F420-dependent oxidoreductase|nr:LLM class F420-dependent oxidoreductase [Pseudomonadales bacterium]MDP6470289.1 LLM class F420-dependent oxidoreductase [Pseudomonadales bacterium]MDP6827195.1 LLM class F420-dependent oxidoreductase [Pseudomonadales bacterium]MDP6972502.1 LLM class F420-dependent oxidoreductase [Pseudomonadales bacterium]|tara:strand:+ start:2601 stop:3458 length:858 start_codon:yes stop_codon:yes gene_type:complete
MRIGVTMAFNHRTDPEFIGAAARLVEDTGFHSVWVPEHVLFFPDYASTYPYSADGRIPGDPVGVLDPFAALTWVAAHTSKLRLGTGICLVPQRQPVYTAKAVADLDYLSGGRVDFGVGIGWLKEEFDNLQMNFGKRAARCVEYLEVMRALWGPGVSRYRGETIELEDCHFNPKPVQTPHPPVLFGGESEAALARVAHHGDGWYGFDLDPNQVGSALASLERHLADAGRHRGDVQVFIGSSSKPVTPETVAAWGDTGIDQLIVPLMAGSLERLEQRRDKLVASLSM